MAEWASGSGCGSLARVVGGFAGRTGRLSVDVGTMGAGLNKKAKERLNSSKREGGTELNFSECDIADFRNFGPVVAMKALVKLDLGKNQILELPPTIEQLKQLTVRTPSVRAHSLAQDLDLNGNKLIKLCPQITAFVNLKRFVIAGNAVSELPPMGGFRNMTYLDISGNKYARSRSRSRRAH